MHILLSRKVKQDGHLVHNGTVALMPRHLRVVRPQWSVLHALPFDRIIHCRIGYVSLFHPAATVIDVDRFAGFGCPEVLHPRLFLGQRGML